MNRKAFFNAMRQAAERDGAEVIEVDADTPALDLRGKVSERPILVLSERPNTVVQADDSAMPGILVIGWRGAQYNCTHTAVEADIAMPECWKAYQADEEKRHDPPLGGFGVVGLTLYMRHAIMPGRDMAEHGGLAAVKAAIDSGVSAEAFGLHTVGKLTVRGGEQYQAPSA